MNPSPTHSFNPDRPIESAEQDKLERVGFAVQLANRVLAWRGQESLVIGLYGDWGSGKSSVKNLIIEKLSKQGNQAPILVEFNPWVVSGEEKITQAFFNEIGGKLEHLDKDPAAKARAASWRNYARAMETGSQLAGVFDLVSPAFGVVAPGVGAWASKRLKQAKELAEKAGTSLESKPASLQETKRELRAHFKGLSKPLLVVIDDIDRLTTDEICLVFRLVKANADFPNTIFLLLFQRETAEKALDAISNDKGREFLQKIVQVDFDLPAPSPASLHQVLLKQIEQMLSPLIPEGEFERERWTNLWLGCLSTYFTNIRGIYRFLNSFTFMLSAFEHDGTLEVNPIDLICIECLRVFEPGVYAEVRDNKPLLTERYGEMARKEIDVLAKRLLDASSGDADNTKRLLKGLFPELESFWANHRFSDELYRAWASQRRVCSPNFFDRYFVLQLPKGQISESTIRSIVALRDDREALRQIFKDQEAKGLLLATLERLEAEQTFDSPKNPVPYLLALADVSDRLPRSKKHLFANSGSMLVRYAVNRVLEKPIDNSRKIEIVSALINDADCVGLTGQWIDDISNPKEDGAYPKIEGEALATLKTRWLQRVREFARQGRLVSIVDLRWLLPYWMQWADPVEAKDWVGSLLADPRQTLAFVKAYIVESTTHKLGSHFVQERVWLSWESIELYQPEEKWSNAANKLAGMDGLSDDEQRTRKAFLAAMQRWEKGITDANARKFEDREDGERDN